MVSSAGILFHFLLIGVVNQALSASITEEDVDFLSPSGSLLQVDDEDVKASPASAPAEGGAWSEPERPAGRGGGRKMPRNYIISDDMTDGEHEIRLHFSGVSAKQTSVGPSEGSSGGLVAQQLSNGRQLLLMIYNGLADTSNVTTGRPSSSLKQTDAIVQELSLKECTIDTDQARVEEFVELFRQQAREARDLVHEAVPIDASNPSFTRVSFSRVRSLSQLPSAVLPLVNFRALKRKCRRHLKAAKVAVKASLRTQRRLQRQQNGLALLGEDGDTPAAHGSSRARRSISDLFILPGTLWCGNQDRAKSSQELSGHVDADACCRQHDLCRYNIFAMTFKYGFFNSNFFTMSHCSCDRGFRTCLKSSNTGAANLVGRVFFDMVRTECFEFKKAKVCKKWSYWGGSCQRYGIQRKAVLRKPLPWTR